MQRDPAFPLPRLLAEFATEHPGIEVQLRRGTTSTHAEELRQGVLDVAFVASHSWPGLHITPLRRTAMVLACPEGHSLAGSSTVSLGDLADERFVTVPRSWAIRLGTDRAFAESGIRHQVAYEVDDIISVVDFVHHGTAVAIVPPPFVPAGTGIRTVPLAGTDLSFNFGLAVAARRPPAVIAQAFTRRTLRLMDDIPRLDP
jgi:DNA-binding transcriptional LysR family regulator